MVKVSSLSENIGVLSFVVT